MNNLFFFKHRPMEVCWVTEMWQRSTASNLHGCKRTAHVVFYKSEEMVSCCYDYPGLEIATNTVAFATRKTRVVANLRLGFAVTDANKKG